MSVGEAQLLWEDRSSGQILVSLRIYFLPENTPDGRCEEHGEVSLAFARAATDRPTTPREAYPACYLTGHRGGTRCRPMRIWRFFIILLKSESAL